MPELDLTRPYVTPEMPGLGGRIRAQVEDFVVEEVSLIEPSGKGDHLYVNLTKQDVTTREVQEQMASLFDVKPVDVGSAGLKDKNSIATQTFSVNLEGRKIELREAREHIDGLGLKVNHLDYHDHKFRSGYIHGNRFTVTITDVKHPRSVIDERAERITDSIHLQGVPNYYGEQRLGRRGKNVVAGWRILNGEKRVRNKWLRRCLVAAYQGYLCNRYLSERITQGKYAELIDGDIVSGHDKENKFWVYDPTVDFSGFKERSLSFTAPMFGHRMIKAEREAASLENEVFTESGLSMKILKRNRVTGSRRIGRLVPDISYDVINNGIKLNFTLRKGGFATTLLREYMKVKKD